MTQTLANHRQVLDVQFGCFCEKHPKTRNFTPQIFKFPESLSHKITFLADLKRKYIMFRFNFASYLGD